MVGTKPPGLFISGTGTGVGKTFVAAAIARALHNTNCRVGVYKPVISGYSVDISDVGDPLDSKCPNDDELLWRAAGCPGELTQVSPQRFRAPLAPHLAARAEGKKVDAQRLRTGILPWQSTVDVILVEGAGGLFSPISDNELNADLAYDLGFPILLVAPNSLGVIHAAVATQLAANGYRGGLPLAAIVMNDLPAACEDESRESNLAELARRCAPCPVIRFPADERHLMELLQNSIVRG